MENKTNRVKYRVSPSTLLAAGMIVVASFFIDFFKGLMQLLCA